MALPPQISCVAEGTIMGYYVSQHSGNEFTITDPTAVLDKLQEAQGDGHISWCNRIETYRNVTTRSPFTECEALNKVLTDFGFDTLTGTGDDDCNHVLVMGWGGDKMGWLWTEVWDAMAAGTDDTVDWIMVGEDYEMWCDRIENHEYQQHGVRIEVVA
jgi:hypothetical protein